MKPTSPTFREKPIDRMCAVGAVDEGSARIWFRSHVPGRHQVHVRSVGEAARASAWSTVDVELSADPLRDNIAIASLESLPAATPHEYRVLRPKDELHDELVIGAGAFRTAPPRGETEQSYSIAVMSCHQPFGDAGQLRDDARTMLAAAVTAMREKRTARVVMIGDQMYADQPPSLSVFDDEHFRGVAPPGRESILDCSTDEVRRLYQERYRLFWSPEGWQEILANYPCYPMLDDHEVIDNWGSDPAHASEEWRSLREGALLAYQDYQGSRVRDRGPDAQRALDYELHYGDLSAIVTDMRSTRSIEEGRLFGAEQLDRIEAFLDENAEQSIVAVITTLPLFHVTELATRIGALLTSDGDDFSDRVVHPAYRGDFDRLCRLLRAHRKRVPEQRFVLLSGDIHVGAISALRWDDEAPCYQLISSGITNPSQVIPNWLSKKAVEAQHRASENEPGPHPRAELLEPTDNNPYTGLNMGFLEVEHEADGRPTLHLSLLGMREGEDAREVVRSTAL